MIHPLLNAEAIKDAFFDAFINKDDCPDVADVLFDIIRSEYEDLTDEIEEEWSEKKREYEAHCQEWYDHVRQHSGPL